MKLSILLLVCALPAFPCTKWWVGGGSTTNWNATTPTNWSTSSGGAGNAAVPGTTDDVCFDANSGNPYTSIIAANITIKSIDCTGSNSGSTITLNSGTDLFVQVGGIKFVSTMAFVASASNSIVEMLGAAVNAQIDLTGQTLKELAFAGSGSWQLVSDANFDSSVGQFVVSQGTVTTNNHNITVGSVNISGASTRSLTLGSSTINVGATGTLWNATTTTGLTFNAGTSTINTTDQSSTGKTFVGGGLTYNNLNLGVGSGSISITGANTFNSLGVIASFAAGTVIFPASVTQTMTTFAITGASGKVITITSSSAGTQATLSKASGNVCSDFLSLKDSNATGGASWFAGAHSTNVSGNAGWTFTACPGGTNVTVPVVAE